MSVGRVVPAFAHQAVLLSPLDGRQQQMLWMVELWKVPGYEAAGKLLCEVSPFLNMGINIYLGSL